MMSKEKSKVLLKWQELKSDPQWRSIAAKLLVSFFLNITLWVCAGLLMKFLEGGLESTYKCGVKRVRRDFIDSLWNETILFDEQSWKSSARRRLIDFENELHDAVDAGIHTYSGQTTWSIRNAIIYAFSLSTTIGFGKLFPTTTSGKLFSILYMVLGNTMFFQLVMDLSKLLVSSIEVVIKAEERQSWNETFKNISIWNCYSIHGSVLFCFISWLLATSMAYILAFQVNPLDAIFSVMAPTATVGFVKNEFDDTSFISINSINFLIGTTLYLMNLSQFRVLFLNNIIMRKLYTGIKNE